MGNYRFIISGGGTGGHIYPAIAIANELKRRFPKAEFLFIGARGKMEMEKVPQAGYQIKGLWISGLQRKLTLKNLWVPFKFLKSWIDALRVINSFKPHMAIGTGGYASAPTMKAASWKKVPYVLQEQNSFAGLVNKISAGNAKKVFVAYDHMERFFPKHKIVKTGNPVRIDLVASTWNVAKAKAFFGLNAKKPVLLILGGSLGARRVNQLIESKLTFFKKLGLQVIWQCGKLYFEEYGSFDAEEVKVKPFLNEMDAAYAAANFIISRAGAGSVSELCIVAKPTIFIPSTNVAEDHQTKNAMALVDQKAALLVAEKDLKVDFEKVFENLFHSPELQSELQGGMRKLARPEATSQIVDIITDLLEE